MPDNRQGHQATFLQLAREAVHRIEESTEPEWWRHVRALTRKMEESRRRLLPNSDPYPACHIVDVKRSDIDTGGYLHFWDIDRECCEGESRSFAKRPELIRQVVLDWSDPTGEAAGGTLLCFQHRGRPPVYSAGMPHDRSGKKTALTWLNRWIRHVETVVPIGSADEADVEAKEKAESTALNDGGDSVSDRPDGVAQKTGQGQSYGADGAHGNAAIEGQPCQIVTLSQAGALVIRSAETIRKLKTLPDPVNNSKPGQANQFDWRELHPVLESEYRMNLPADFPASMIKNPKK